MNQITYEHLTVATRDNNSNRTEANCNLHGIFFKSSSYHHFLMDWIFTRYVTFKRGMSLMAPMLVASLRLYTFHLDAFKMVYKPLLISKSREDTLLFIFACIHFSVWRNDNSFVWVGCIPFYYLKEKGAQNFFIIYFSFQLKISPR